MNVKHIIAPGRDLHTRASHLNQQSLPRSRRRREIGSYFEMDDPRSRRQRGEPSGVELCGNAADLSSGLLGLWWLRTLRALVLGRQLD